MIDVLLWVILIIVSCTALIAFGLFLRFLRGNDAIGKEVREELRCGREESRTADRELREEMAGSLKASADMISRTWETIAKAQQAQLDSMTQQLKELIESNRVALEGIHSSIYVRIKELQEGNENKLNEMRKAVGDSVDSNRVAMENIRSSIDVRIKELQEGNEKKLDDMRKVVGDSVDSNRVSMENIRNSIDVRIKELQEGNEKKLDEIRKINGDSVDSNRISMENIRNSIDVRIKELQEGNEKKLDEIRKVNADSVDANRIGMENTRNSIDVRIKGLQEGNEKKLDEMRKAVGDSVDSNRVAMENIRSSIDVRIKELQEGNEKKLDEMRKVVDEKLHDTLEKRLGESFRLVSDRLDAVHKGLGEMQSLANGVGDLKRVLSNVKVRGTWAEVQLGALLEQILTPEQYAKNVCVKPNSSERVEFAIRLPGSKDKHESHVWLPIDSKFPQEDYLRLLEASEKAELASVQAATDALMRSVRSAAKDIHDKYVSPPETTDFAVMFLATEGLYAEVLRLPAFVEELQQKYRVVVAGPATLVAILSSLRMGFQTLAIEKRASEVWRILGAVKMEFSKFGDALDKVKRQLNTASKTIDETGVRTRAIERRLKSVEQITDAEASRLLALPDENAGVDDNVNAPEFEAKES